MAQDKKLKAFQILDRSVDNEKMDTNKSILVPFDIPLTKYDAKGNIEIAFAILFY